MISNPTHFTNPAPIPQANPAPIPQAPAAPRFSPFYRNPLQFFTQTDLFCRAMTTLPYPEGGALFNGYATPLVLGVRLLMPLLGPSFDYLVKNPYRRMLYPPPFSMCTDELAGFTSFQELSRLSGLTGLVKLAETVMSVAYGVVVDSTKPLDLGIDWPTQFDPLRCRANHFNSLEGLKVLALGLCFYQAWIYSRNNPTLNQMVGGRGALLKSALAMYFLVVLSDAALIAFRE